MCVFFFFSHDYFIFYYRILHGRELTLNCMLLSLWFGCAVAAEKRSALQRRSWSLSRKGKEGREMPGWCVCVSQPSLDTSLTHSLTHSIIHSLTHSFIDSLQTFSFSKQIDKEYIFLSHFYLISLSSSSIENRHIYIFLYKLTQSYLSLHSFPLFTHIHTPKKTTHTHTHTHTHLHILLLPA